MQADASSAQRGGMGEREKAAGEGGQQEKLPKMK